MKKVFRLLICIVSITLISCGGSNEKKLNENPSISDVMDYSNKVQEGTKKAANRTEERRKRGDTMAMPYKELQAYLPEIKGYEKKGGPTGSQSNSPMGSFSQAKQKYQNADNNVTVSIVDYNSAHQAFMGLTAAYGMGFSFEDDDKKQGPSDFKKDGIAGYETIYKDGNRGDLVLVVADRFIINIEARGEGSETFLNAIANDINLDALAKK